MVANSQFKGFKLNLFLSHFSPLLSPSDAKPELYPRGLPVSCACFIYVYSILKMSPEFR